jgi:hypothetical protein
MRLWSLHPRYLDAKGLVALWREALLAQAVLKGRTRGYTQHPQLLRFREAERPVVAIAEYLQAVHDEASRRGYRFDRRKIGRRVNNVGPHQALKVTRGQIQYEWKHLQAKLERRSPDWLKALKKTGRTEPHPAFQVVAGRVEKWERT